MNVRELKEAKCDNLFENSQNVQEVLKTNKEKILEKQRGFKDFRVVQFNLSNIHSRTTFPVAPAAFSPFSGPKSGTIKAVVYIRVESPTEFGNISQVPPNHRQPMIFV